MYEHVAIAREPSTVSTTGVGCDNVTIPDLVQERSTGYNRYDGEQVVSMEPHAANDTTYPNIT